MRRLLIVSTVSRQFYLFERLNIEVLQSLGVEVHGAANFADASDRLGEVGIIKHHIDIQRSPLSPMNLLALYQLIRLIKQFRIDAIHCHSPVGGVLARLAGILTGIEPLIYTAHGFHFYRGAPWLNWALYYPIEKLLAARTNLILTINKEDYIAATRLRPGHAEKVPGIGVFSERFPTLSDEARGRVRKEIGVEGDALLLLSVGELNANKNQRLVVEALVLLSPAIKVHYVLCGTGEQHSLLKRLAAEKGVLDKVSFLGFRDDVPTLMASADVFIHPSLREGLPVAVIEAMCAGLPCVVSDVRGNSDLIHDGQGGYVVAPSDIQACADAISLLADGERRQAMGSHNKNAAEAYTANRVRQVMIEIYRQQLSGGAK